MKHHVGLYDDLAHFDQLVIGKVHLQVPLHLREVERNLPQLLQFEVEYRHQTEHRLYLGQLLVKELPVLHPNARAGVPSPPVIREDEWR